MTTALATTPLEKYPQVPEMLDLLRLAAERVNLRQIETADECAEWAGWLTGVHSMKKSVEARHALEKEPYLRAGQKIDKLKRDILAPVDALETAIKRGISVWRAKEAERIAEEQRKIDEENQRRAREAEAERQKRERETLAQAEEAGFTPEESAELANLEAAAVPAPILSAVPVQEKTVSTPGGSVGARLIWKFETVNIRTVPDQYLQINEPAVNRAIREGVREIPGLRIYQEETLAVRTA